MVVCLMENGLIMMVTEPCYAPHSVFESPGLSESAWEVGGLKVLRAP